MIVGLDYYDNEISKDSPIGVSSKQILTNILRIKKLGCDVSISSVYNKDINNKIEMIKWSMENGVRIKILEIVKNEKEKQTSEEFIEMENKIKNLFKLKYIKDEFNEINGYKDKTRVITFFHSHCRLRECDICKKIHLRITAEGKMKQCMYTNEDDIDTQNKNFKDELKNYISKPAKIYD